MADMKKQCTEQVVLATYDIQFKLNERLPIPKSVKKLNFCYLINGDDVTYIKPENIRMYEEEFKGLSVTERFETAEYLFKAWQQNIGNKHIYDRFCAIAFKHYITSEDSESECFWKDFGVLLQSIDKENNDQWCFLKYYISKLCVVSAKQSERMWNTFIKCELKYKLWLEYLVLCDYRKRYHKQEKNHQDKMLAEKTNCSWILERLLSSDDFISELTGAMIADSSDLEQELIWSQLNTISHNAKSFGMQMLLDKNHFPSQCANIHHVAFMVKTELMSYNKYGVFTEQFKYKRYIHLRNNETSKKPFTRNDYKLLSKYFPYTSDIDKSHMTTNLAALIYALLHPSADHPDFAHFDYIDMLTKINGVLKYVAIGTNQVLICVVLIATLGHECGADITEKIISRNYLLLSDENKFTLLKLFSTCIRRTQKYINVKLSARQISALCYFELCFGRSDSISN